MQFPMQQCGVLLMVAKVMKYDDCVLRWNMRRRQGRWGCMNWKEDQHNGWVMKLSKLLQSMVTGFVILFFSQLVWVWVMVMLWRVVAVAIVIAIVIAVVVVVVGVVVGVVVVILLLLVVVVNNVRRIVKVATAKYNNKTITSTSMPMNNQISANNYTKSMPHHTAN